jgi:tRNA(Arg) A34 adenosine deaminase TadA
MEYNTEYLKLACDLATLSIKRGGGPFGAVVIKNDSQEIVGRGHNMVAIEKDPTLHAEMVAIKNACRFLGDFNLSGCSLYTSCEPCPMCLSACYWARIPVIYYGNTKNDAKKINFDDSFIYDEIKKSNEERTIKMVRLTECSQYSIQSFNTWEEKEDRILY